MSYEDYLQVLLMTKSKKEKLERGMDMIEVSIREKREGTVFGWTAVLRR